MLTLASAERLPRLEYVWSVFCERLWNLPARYAHDAEAQGVEIRDENGVLLRFPALHPLLHSGFQEKIILPSATGPETRLFPAPEGPLSQDVFAAAFWLLNEYELGPDFTLDEHGRYEESQRQLLRCRLHERPWVHELADELRGALLAQAPRLPFQAPAFSWEIGFDIDWPYRYRGRSFWVHAAALLRDLLRLNVPESRRRMDFLLRGKDPYDTYVRILESFHEENLSERLLFFFLIHAGHRYDTTFGDRNAAYNALIRRLSETGAFVGVHPSYESAESPEMIGRQTRRLAEIAGQPVTLSRQHFLKLKTPETYRALLEAGIRDEYTGCLHSRTGWRFGMAAPFPWYDRWREESTALTLHPVAAMDRSLMQYEGRSPDDSLKRLLELIGQARQVGGRFHLLLHNDTLSELPPWTGWLAVYGSVLDALRGE